MTQELHYTSAPRGLKPGARGFCTVACTAGLSPTLAERLEGLSGYRPKFPPDHPEAARNPVAWSHVRLSVAGQTVSVVSRVGPAGLDYTERPNKHAHHVVLDASERPEGGPAWLLAQPGFMASSWDGPPQQIPSGRPAPSGDRLGGICRAWEAQAGDAGWAGAVAESFLKDPRRAVVVVFDPGTDVLSLFAEAIALLPLERRWDVTFQTYFTGIAPGVTCAWRGVLRDTPEERQARGNPEALLIDLAATDGRATGGALVHWARTGEGPAIPSPSLELIDSDRPSYLERPVGSRGTTRRKPFHFSAPAEIGTAHDPYAVVPPLRSPSSEPARKHGNRSNPTSRVSGKLTAWVVAAVAIVAFLLGVTSGAAVALLWVRPGSDQAQMALAELVNERVPENSNPARLSTPTDSDRKPAVPKEEPGAEVKAALPRAGDSELSGSSNPDEKPARPGSSEASTGAVNSQTSNSPPAQKPGMISGTPAQPGTGIISNPLPPSPSGGDTPPRDDDGRRGSAKPLPVLEFSELSDLPAGLKIGPYKSSVRNLKLLGVEDEAISPYKFTVEHSKNKMIVSRISDGKPIQVAIFASDGGVIKFEWSDSSPEARNALRECVLVIELESSAVDYRLLRKPSLNQNISLGDLPKRKGKPQKGGGFVSILDWIDHRDPYCKMTKEKRTSRNIEILEAHFIKSINNCSISIYKEEGRPQPGKPTVRLSAEVPWEVRIEWDEEDVAPSDKYLNNLESQKANLALSLSTFDQDQKKQRNFQIAEIDKALDEGKRRKARWETIRRSGVSLGLGITIGKNKFLLPEFVIPSNESNKGTSR